MTSSSVGQRITISRSILEICLNLTTPVHSLIGYLVVKLVQFRLLNPKKIYRITSPFVKAYMSNLSDNTEKQRLYWRFFGPAYLESQMNDFLANQHKFGPYLREITKLIEEHKVGGCFELGCGYFRNLSILRQRFPNLKLAGMDYSGGCDQIYLEQKLSEKNIAFVHDSVVELPKYRASHELDLYDLFFTFGLLTYLSYDECLKLLREIRSFQNVKYVSLTEPARCSSKDLDEVEAAQYRGRIDQLNESINRGDTFVHNYFKLLKEAGWDVASSEYYNDFGGIFLLATKSP